MLHEEGVIGYCPDLYTSSWPAASSFGVDLFEPSLRRALGVPMTDHTYEDCRLMISAGELTLPMEAGLVEFTKISRKLK